MLRASNFMQRSPRAGFSSSPAAPVRASCRYFVARCTKGELASNASSSSARKFLQKAIEEAVKQEDYKAAANLKKELERVNTADPIYSLKSQLEEAVKVEDYEKAAQLHKELEALEDVERSAQTEQRAAGEAECSSVAVTRGVKVSVQSVFRPLESRQQSSVLGKKSGQYFFNYHVTITNEGSEIVQLKNRHWVIRHEDGRTEEVRGPGVVGAQPLLRPGESFEYSSFCPLSTPVGSMEGEFEMVVLDEKDGEVKDTFDAKVAMFKLIATCTE